MTSLDDLGSTTTIALGTKLIETLTKLLSKNLSGKLDSKDFASISPNASGRRFIIKGWVDKQAGPAIRFSAPWGDLGDGYVLYQATPDAEWDDVEETNIDLDFSWDEVVLTVNFTLEDGTAHCAVFTGTP